MKKPVVLAVLDGLGIRKENQGNAYNQARTPHFDALLKNYPNAVLQASGEFVGLPKGQIGNSEVGHLSIGAGTVVYTGLNLINFAIETKEFFKNPEFQNAIDFAKKNRSSIHLMGLLSPGGVHSHENHLFALLDLLHTQQVKSVYVHAFGDGRDVQPQSIKPSLMRLAKVVRQYGYAIASISGRYFAMDRDTNFDLVEKAYQAILGKSASTFTDPVAFVDDEYQKGHTDEFFTPSILRGYQGMQSNDAIIFFNFRPDRARQLAHLLVGSNVYQVKPSVQLQNLYLVAMMKYEGIERAHVAYGSMEIKTPLGKVFEQSNLRQLRIAETQKYAHVTFFMDGGIELPLKNSDRILIPSLKVESYATAPQMSAREITDKLISELPNFDVVIMNYANCDMVGHTGDLKAAIKAVEVIDECIGKLQLAIDALGGTLFITADHGNAEIMEDETGARVTKHTISPVFLICTDKQVRLVDGALPNVAPTLLDYLSLPKPATMLSDSLIKK